MIEVEPPPAKPRAGRRGYALAALALVVVAVGAVVFARGIDPARVGVGAPDPNNLPVGPEAPRLAGDTGWINSPPLTEADLAGKVVVYDFWTYSCVNCVRTLPYLRAWYDRYAPDGLVIVGVHSPEFEFEKARANVEAATMRLGVTWPVVQDNRKAIWDRFANQWWPAKYVADRDGKLRYTHIGEGAYTETENVLRSLLGVDEAAPRAGSSPDPAETSPAGALITPETYLGGLRGQTGARAGERTYPEPGPLVPGEARLVGTWETDEESVYAMQPGAAIVLQYRAREVNLVLAPPRDGVVDVSVLLDGQPLPPAYRAGDVRVDEAGATTIRVDQPRMYRIVLGPGVEEHQLRLTAAARGMTAYAFTFGG
ncbi:MAG: redoxin family protein [Acidimicrobiales bacterium]